MKLTTWNVNGIRARETQVLDWVKTEAPDVLCLQEIKASPEHIPESMKLEGYWSYWHGHKGYSGVSLHVRKEAVSMPPTFAHPEFDHEHRIVTTQLGRVVVASIYVPNGGKDFVAKMRFLEAMVAYVGALHAQNLGVVLMGDLNVARLEVDVHPKLRKPEQIGQTPQERALFEQLLTQGLVDLSRQFEPSNDRLFTWWAPWRNMRERNIGWRLDYVLCSAALAATATACEAKREFGTSNHGPVTALFQEGEIWRGPGAPPGKIADPPLPPKGQLTFDLPQR